MKAKKFLGMSLASAMALTVVGCSSSNGGSSTATTPDAGNNDKTTEADNTDATEEGTKPAAPSEKRVVTMGSWWDIYYTSEHDDPDDQPNITNYETAQMQIDNVRKLEEKYNCEFYTENMTWDGIIGSINASIMAGKPDVDIYMSDLQFGVPAVLKGYAQNTADYGATDRLEEAAVVKGLKIGTSEDCYLFQEQAISSNSVYVLGFDMDRIKAKGLENPQDLYEKGEWTWDKFMEYMKALTEDTDGDGVTDKYGYGGWWTVFFQYMLMANDADISATNEEHLSDPKTVETLEFIYDMYNVSKVARPWALDDDHSWEYNNDYRSGEMAFWISANWIAQDGKDSDPDASFEVGFVPFPMGPSCDGDYNTKATAGNWYFIPKGIEDADFCFDVFYDWINWYDYDNDYRDDNEWAQNVTYAPKAEDPERNFNILLEASFKEAYDPWQSLQEDGQGIIGLGGVMDGSQTAAQYVEENKQRVQNALDQLFK